MLTTDDAGPGRGRAYGMRRTGDLSFTAPDPYVYHDTFFVSRRLI